MLSIDHEKTTLLPSGSVHSILTRRSSNEVAPSVNIPMADLSAISEVGYGLRLSASNQHQPLSEAVSMPAFASSERIPSVSVPAQQRMLGPPQRPKLRGGGGNLAGVRLYRQRTANSGEPESANAASNQSQTNPRLSSADASRKSRAQSIFSTRSLGVSQKDRGSLRYRRIQNKIYNILERPKDCRAISYHVLSFAVVFACLVLSIVQSADDSINLLNEISMSVELLMLLWFTTEYVLRIWSAGCRSKYQSFIGRLRFARRPLCIVDAIVIIASILVVIMNASSRISHAANSLMNVETAETGAGGGNMVPALRGLRFFQIMRMMRLDRRGSSWRLLSSVIWAHRQELFTAIYTGFLVLIFASFAMYLAEREVNEKQFKSYADALWWGVITLCTVGYGDKVPQSAMGRVIGSFCAMVGISFFALPPGILGSGLALKVQQQQRQKHQIRRRVPAAMLIQALWRMVGTEHGTVLYSTWQFYISHQRRTKQLLCSGTPAQMPWAPPTVSNRLHQAAGRFVNVSRRSVRDRVSESGSSAPGITMRQYAQPPREPSPEGSPNRNRSQSQENQNPTGPLTTAQCNVIRAVRRMKFLVCRRKLRESMRPYDVKDVIEQYSSGHAEILSRLRQLQYRMDDMTISMASSLRGAFPGQSAQQSVGRENSSPLTGRPLQLQHSFNGRFDSPLRNAVSPPLMTSEDEQQSLQWKVHMLDRKLDMLIAYVTTGSNSIPDSTAATTDGTSAATATVISPDLSLKHASRSLPPTPVVGARTAHVSGAKSQPECLEVAVREASSIADALGKAEEKNEEPMIVSGIVVDNESCV